MIKSFWELLGMTRGTIFGIWAHFMKKGCISKITWAYEVISNQCIQWRSIIVLLANNGYLFLKSIFLIMQHSLHLETQFFECIHRWVLDNIWVMYIWIRWSLEVTRDHRNSLEVTRGQELATTPRDNIFQMYIKMSFSNCTE